MLKVAKNGNWQLYWGYTSLPVGAEAAGTVQRENLETGALIRLSTGVYVQGNARSIRTLDQTEVKAAIARSEAAAALGSSASAAKAEAARENGRKGGRPRVTPPAARNDE